MEMEIKPQAAYTDEEMKPYQDIRIRHTFVRTSLLLFYSLWGCFLSKSMLSIVGV